MATTLEEKYGQEGTYPSPQNKGKMTQDYILGKVQYIFSNYIRGVDATKYTSRAYYQELRDYLAGRQAEQKYMPYFLGSGSGTSTTFTNEGVDIGGGTDRKFDIREFARKAMAHMNWQVMSPMPKIMNKILSGFYGNMYNINIECIDENSIAEQDERKWLAYVQSQQDTIELMTQLSQAAGVPYAPPQKRFETIEELELEEANGGFKLNYAKEGEKVIKDAWNISNDTELHDKWLADLTCLNVAGARVYYDREIGKEMVRWCDPAMSGIQFSKHNDFRDSSYGYELIFLPAYKLQSYGISAVDVAAVAQRYAGMYGNPEWSNEYELLDQPDIDLKCGFFKVPVLDVEWIDVETERKVRYKNSYGQERVREYVDGEKLSANKQYEETKLHKVYQCKWVVDTEIIFEFGLKPNQPRREKNQSLLSFHFVKGKTEQSLVEQLMPVLDSFQLNWLKFQDAKASAVKAGYVYEWEALTGMAGGGGEKLNPWDIIKMHRISGNLIYSRRQRHLPNQAAGVPAQFMPNGMGTAVADFIAAMDTDARMIEEITGINPVALGATADPRAGKAVTEMSVSSSGAPIKNIYDKLFKLKEDASLDLLMRVQLDMRNSQTVQKRYASVVGAFGVQTLIEAEGKGVKFGTKLTARPTDEDLAILKVYIDTALSNGRNGVTGLTIPDAIYITRRIKEGADMVEIEQYISYKLKKADKEAQAAAQAAAQQNIEGQQQAIALKAQVDIQNAQLEVEKTNAINEGKFYFDAWLENVKSANKIKETQSSNGQTQLVFPSTPPTPDTVIDGQAAAAQQPLQQQPLQPPMV
jgi:hypothetical protein